MGDESGFTLIELMCVVGIVGILAATAMAHVPGILQKARYSRAKRDLDAFRTEITQYLASNGEFPDNWSQIGHESPPKDPWGNEYKLMNFDQINPGDRRKDGPVVPINTRYDLFSPGPNGSWDPNINTPGSRDDVIVAEDGAFIGKASDY